MNGHIGGMAALLRKRDMVLPRVITMAVKLGHSRRILDKVCS